MELPLDSRLSPLFASQRGIAHTTQVTDAGGTRTMVRSRFHSGLWVQEDRNVVRLASVPLTWEGRLLVAQLASGGLISHFSLARLLGLAGFDQDVPHITIGNEQRWERPDVFVHRTKLIELCDPVFVAGILATGPSRLVLDLARWIPILELIRLVDELRRRGLVTWESIIDTYSAHRRRGRGGIRNLGLIIDVYGGGTAVCESPLEELALTVMREDGLPEPDRQVVIEDDDGNFVMRSDLGYRNKKVAIEADSVEFHLNRVAFEADKRKRRRARSLGWAVCEVTDFQLRNEPREFLADVRAELSRRSSATLEKT